MSACEPHFSPIFTYNSFICQTLSLPLLPYIFLHLQRLMGIFCVGWLGVGDVRVWNGLSGSIEPAPFPTPTTPQPDIARLVVVVHHFNCKLGSHPVLLLSFQKHQAPLHRPVGRSVCVSDLEERMKRLNTKKNPNFVKRRQFLDMSQFPSNLAVLAQFGPFGSYFQSISLSFIRFPLNLKFLEPSRFQLRISSSQHLPRRIPRQQR